MSRQNSFPRDLAAWDPDRLAEQIDAASRAAVTPTEDLTMPSHESNRQAVRPHIYLRDGRWWVRCKHRNPTGPYLLRRTAYRVARDIWAT